MIQCHYHTGPIDKSGDSIKKTFNFLNLLPPPSTHDDEYDRHINSSKNAEADAMLDQPSEKRAAIRKDVFIKGRQSSLDDVLAFCGNFIIFARFWSKVDQDSHKQPLLVQLFTEVADQISSSEFKRFFENHKNEKPYLAHTMIAYLFNISSIFIKMSKNPNVVRRFKMEQVVKHDEIRMGLMMHQSLMDQLQLCAVTSSPQNLFAQPPSSYKVFFPETKKEQLKRPNPFQDGEPGKAQKVGEKGSIVNDTGNKLWFPKGLEKKYCADFIDTKTTCKHGERCHFEHAVYPTGFATKDIKIIDELVKNTDGLSFKSGQKMVRN